MSWKAYEVTLLDDPSSHAGKIEILNELYINETMPTYTSGLLVVPPLSFNYGLHKLVFRFDVETFHPDIEMFREAYTYFNVTKSPLQPILIEGSIAKLSRGWGQSLLLPAESLSSDPDWPGENVNCHICLL